MKYKDNCFGAIKLIAAFLVIASHAFPICTNENFIINKITNNQFDLGNFSVCIFFITGGFFITKSLLTSKNVKEYLVKRIKRIFPPLIFAMFVTTFILAPFFYDGSILNYFKSGTTYLYFIKNSLMLTTHSLPGVFSNNIYTGSVNGSLWSLPIEFLCYIAILVAMIIKLLDKKNIKLTIMLFLMLTLIHPILYKYIPILEVLLPLGLLFLEGAIYYINRDKINFNSTKLALICLILILISFPLNLYSYTKILCLPYVIYYIGFKFKNFRIAFENISYDIYLYSFFIQQAICFMFGGSMNPIINILFAIPTTILVAYISNRLLNKLLSKKNKEA